MCAFFKPIKILCGHDCIIMEICKGREESLLWSVDCEENVKQWDWRKGVCVRSVCFKGFSELRRGVFMENEMLVFGDEDGVVALGDLKSGKVVKKFRRHRNKVNDIVVGGGVGVSCAEEGSVYLWSCFGVEGDVD